MPAGRHGLVKEGILSAPGMAVTPTGPRPRGSPSRDPRVSRLLHTPVLFFAVLLGSPLRGNQLLQTQTHTLPGMQGRPRRPGRSARPTAAHPGAGFTALCTLGCGTLSCRRGDRAPRRRFRVQQAAPAFGRRVHPLGTRGHERCVPWGGRGLETGSGPVDFDPTVYQG